MHIRKATLDDLKSIQELNLLLFKKEKKEYDQRLDLSWTYGTIGTSFFTKRITNEDSFAVVAESKGNLVGYLVGSIKAPHNYRKIKKSAELENMLVLEEFRNQKIGTKFFQQFLTWAKKKKVEIITVAVSAKNTKGINFYKKAGFKDYDVTLEYDITHPRKN